MLTHLLQSVLGAAHAGGRLQRRDLDMNNVKNDDNPPVCKPNHSTHNALPACRALFEAFACIFDLDFLPLPFEVLFHVLVLCLVVRHVF